MRILMSIMVFHPIVGGTERSALDLGRALVKLGHTVDVVTLRFKGVATNEVIDGVRVHRQLLGWGRGILFAASYIVSLSFFLLRHRSRFDVIQAYYVYLDALVCSLLRPFLKSRVIIRLGGGGPAGDLSRLRRLRLDRWVGPILRKLDRFVVMSQPMRQELIEFGIDPLHIEQIPTGVDASHFSLGHSLNSSQVVCVARLSPEKGIDTLLSAWRLVIDQVPEAKLVILGDGPAREQLQKQIRELNLVGVEFMGQVQDVLPYLQRSGIFVLPSRSEGLPNALLQAMATGLACVATTVGGIPEVIQQGGNGYLVAPGDPNALSERLLELLADPEKRHRMGLAARQTVETHYTMDAMVERYLQCYQSDEVDLAKQKMPLDPITEGTYVIGEEK